MSTNDVQPAASEQHTASADGETGGFRFAGFWIRCLASLVDTVVMLLVIVPLLYAIYGLAYFTSEEIIQGIPDLLLQYALPFVATVVFWVYKGATPGKMVTGIKVVDSKTGQTPTLKQSLLRYVGYVVSTIPFLLGFIWIAFDSKKQGWHDKISGTLVVDKASLPTA